ncbi:MAG: aryl-sulfate sulfotransferase [Anaerolineae bacterium]|nr:aryl-sulfate sulfotransferase [Anaerolineae bacterium]
MHKPASQKTAQLIYKLSHSLWLTSILWLVVACHQPTSKPFQLHNIHVTIPQYNHLSAILQFTTTISTVAEVLVQNDTHSVTVPTASTPNRDHTIHILGLRPQQTYTLTLTATDETGHSQQNVFPLQTDLLPDDFPPLQLISSRPEAMQPGITLFNPGRWLPTPDLKWGYLVGVDQTGHVVWYHKESCRINFFTQTQRGNVLYLCPPYRAVEINLFGEIIHVWNPTEINPELRHFHHEFIEMPSGNLLALSTEMRTIDGYVDDDNQPVSYDLVGDVVVEFTPEGRLVNRWSVFDMIDPHRIKHGFEATFFYKLIYEEVSDAPRDWTHGNAIFYDETDDTVLVSLRHQDWIIKFSRKTGKLVWRFGEDGDFSLQGDGIWPTQQHAVKMLADNTLLMFDNGTHRNGIQDVNQLYSRVVQYRLDVSSSNRQDWSASQIWEFRDKEPFYSPILSEADLMKNGNILIADGARVSDLDKDVGAHDNSKWARIIEVTGENAPEVVFELTIKDPIPQPDGVGYTVTRVEKLDDLYPH